MTKNALVLGGGGLLGVAWETGVLAGLREEGVDVATADLVVGTSAGSIVGTVVAAGHFDELLEQQEEAADPAISAIMAQVDLAELMKTFARWAAFDEATIDAIKEIGDIALNAKTAPESDWVAYFENILPVSEWPEKALKLTAVEASTGEFAAWDRHSGVDLWRAVASSCAVPGLFPTVTIKGGRYTDGGVRSGTNADLAAGYDAVLMIAPIGSAASGIDPLLGKMSKAEAAALKKQGSSVELQFPDADSLDAMGINRMDATRRPQVIEAGTRQGRGLASAIAEAWAKAAV
jgi:NTE family protein